MKVLSYLFGVLLFFVMVPSVFAQTSLLAPVPENTFTLPSIKVVSPQKDSVVSSRINLEFEVSNFELTARPVESTQSGVISLYVDGKFFTNVASNSASISLPRAGTHFIEAELTRVDRSAFVPRVKDSLYLHVQKKSPFLMVKDLRTDTFVYSATPTFSVEYLPASFEDKSSYYQVFVDGEVDGTSKEQPDISKYTVKNPLSIGRHSLRFALYTQNDRPYTPTIEYQIPFTYSGVRPAIEDVKIGRDLSSGREVPFELILSNFELGKDGYVDVLAEGIHYYLSSPKSILPRLSVGNQKLTFTLLDKNGYPLNPSVSTQKVVVITALNNSSETFNSLIPTGIFTTADGQEPRWGFIILGIIEAITIVVFGVLLLRHERRHK